MSNEPNFDDIQALLAARRDIAPPEDYFDGIVEKLHQRQMAEMLKARKSIWSRVGNFTDSLSESISFTQAWRYAVPAMAACLLLFFGVFFAPGTKAPTPVLASLSLEEQQSFVASFGEDYGTSKNLLAPPTVPRVDKSVDEIPHYVAQGPQGVDAVVAF